jgi:V/A-type H+-transporting ATPase subunit D
MEKTTATTRQELLRLKNQLVEVRSGYRLLEQKRDSLIKAFMELKGEFLARKEKLFSALREVAGFYDLAVKTNPISALDAVASRSEGKILLNSRTQSVMGVKTTIFSIKDFSPPRIDQSETSRSQLVAVRKLTELFPELIEIASLEDALIKLAGAIERTRRRVNVLRDVVMPTIKEQIKHINLKLADQERESLVFNLKFKKRQVRAAV